MATFLGKSIHTLDDKGRLILPKRVLDEVAPKDRDFTLTAGPEGCLWLLETEAWTSVSKHTGDQILVSKAQRDMRRIFLGHAEAVKPDKSNRIGIAEGLRELADLRASEEVVLVGTGQNLEIWARERWDAALAGALSGYEFSDNDLVGSTATSQP